MKKKLLIFIPVVLVLILGVCTYFYLSNKTSTIITLDINPSIEIHLKSNEEVKEIIPLNDDAKKVVSDSMVGTNIYEAISLITRKVVDEGFVPDGELSIILYSEGNEVSNLEKTIKDDFKKEGREVTLIKVDYVSDEDKELAKKYNISPAKVSYLNELTEENENVTVETLIEKPVKEIEEFKESGFYCDSGYTLEGDRCVKEIGREPAKEGYVCQSGYIEYKGKCYRETGLIDLDEVECPKDRTLIDGECVFRIEEKPEPEYECSKGELMRKGDVNPIGAKDNDKMYCIDKSTGKSPTLKCLLNSGHIMINGNCYNGPAPTINGGCPNGDTLRNGKCYSKDDGSQWQCPDGHIYDKSLKLCPDTLTYIEPTLKGYKCNDGFTLIDNKCIKEDIEYAMHKQGCPSGYTLADDNRCYDFSKSVEKINGYYCEKEARLEGNECIILEVKEANK